MLVPSKTANWDGSSDSSREERMSPPGAATSGLSPWPKAVGPAEKKVTTPLRSVWICRTRRVDPICAAPAAGAERPEPRAVEVGDHARRHIDLDRDPARRAGAVVDEHHADARRPPSRVRPSRRSCRSRARRARSTRRASRPEAGCTRRSGCPAGRTDAGRRRVPSRPTMVPMSTSVCAVERPRAGSAGAPQAGTGSAAARGQRSATDHVSDGVKTWLFVSRRR